MARDNRLWGAERIRGELLKLGIHVSKRTIQKYLRQTPGSRVPLREATAFGEGPKYLIRDNDSKFGMSFARVAHTNHIEMLNIPYNAPRAHATCERLLGSVRRECLDHLLILHEKQLHRVLGAYIHYFNRARHDLGIRQQIPEQKAGSVLPDHTGGKLISFPVLGGLHHEYRRSA